MVAVAQRSNLALAKDNLYSTASVNRFCKEAQKIIANTNLEAINVIWESFGTAGPSPTGFVGADATPYESPQGSQLPLTTHQYVTYGIYPHSHKEYPQVISCKMKRWDALRV